jgi:uncharacterized delta-60 repeat protein
MTACAVVSIACSNGKSPVEPSINDLPVTISTGTENRSLLAVYDAVIDPEFKTFTITPSALITPSDRTAQFHFPLTQKYPNVLKITGYGFTPNFWADIQLIHPLPGSGIDAFDPRVIAILPANPGVRFIYPVLGVGGNNAVVLEPDGYTKLFDSLGGTISGNVNPFKAYFKDQPNRIWSSAENIEETQRWQMKLSGFGGPLQYKLVVDVSTNYPNAPQPIIDNAKEPVSISAKIGPGLSPDGGSAEISVTLLDWQGQSDIGGVMVESPDLFNGTVSLAYSAPGPDPDEYIYTGTITNSRFASWGEYKILVASWDKITGIYIYDEFSARVSGGYLEWAKRAGAPEYDYGSAITTLSDNSTVVAGTFVGTATFGPGDANETILTSAGGSDIYVARYNSDGALVWAKRAGGAEYDYGSGITVLSDDSIVAVGYFQLTSVFGQNDPNQTTLISSGQYDTFIAQYNPDGSLAWVKRAGGLDFDDGMAISSLSDNSTVVAGHFETSCTFGPGEPNETILTSDGEHDIFVAHYNTNGTLDWVKRAGGTLANYAYSITSLTDNSTVIAGEFWGTVTFGLGEPNQTILTANNLCDIFVAQYNPDGTLGWAKRAGGSAVDYGKGITALSDNSTVVTGHFKTTAVFGPGEPNQTYLTSAGNADLFVARYNPDGTLVWAKRAGGKALYGDHGYGITSLSDDSTVVTGDFYESATFGLGEKNQVVLTCGTGNMDIFIARYNPDGTFAWAKSAGGSYYDCSYSVTALSDDSTIITGYFQDSAIFGPGEDSETILISAGSWDTFVARFEP